MVGPALFLFEPLMRATSYQGCGFPVAGLGRDILESEGGQGHPLVMKEIEGKCPINDLQGF